MVKLGTFCGFCCFYDPEKKTCGQDLIKVFQSRNAEIKFDENENHTIDRLCQYRRNIDWNENKSIDEKIEICKNEIYVKGTILIVANSIDNFEKTIDKIKDIKNISNFKLIVIYDSIKFIDLKNSIENRIKIKYNLASIKNNNIYYQIYRSLKYAQNGYLFIIDSNKEIENNMIDKVNSFVNKSMYRMLHIKPVDDSFHQSVSMIGIYKWLKGDLQFKFADKLTSIAKEENSDSQTFTWEEVNNAYTC